MAKLGPIISLKNITRQFTAGRGETITILDKVSLDIQRGSFNVIRGESGSGKTTLLRILGMLDTDFDGDYQFEDVSVGDKNDWYLDELRAQNIGFIFQEGRLFDHMTMRKNIHVPLEMHGMRDPTKLGETVKKLEPTFFSAKEIAEETLDLKPGPASGGQKQRAAVMRAIVNKPSIILADEPTASLHGEKKEEVVQHLQMLCDAGHTVIVVSHDKVFFDIGNQFDLENGILTEARSEPPSKAEPIPSRMPAEGASFMWGWKPRAPFSILLAQAIRETLFRPIFLSLILVSLIVGVTQVSVFTSVILGAQEYVNEKITQGSRLNRIQIKPKAKDRGKPERFPLRAEIAELAAVQSVVPRRATSTRIKVLDGSTKTYSVTGLHANDPEYKLLTFAAGGPFTGAHDAPEVIVTAGLLAEAYDTSAVGKGTQTYQDFIGKPLSLIVNRYNLKKKLVGEEGVTLKITGVILNGEGGRQLYYPNQTLLLFDSLIRDRKGVFTLGEDAGINNWPNAEKLAEMTDFPWEDNLQVYASEMKNVLGLYSHLSKIGYRPESDIWDFKWALDIQDTAWRIFLPLLVLIVLSVAITVAANIFTSAKLRETELALWRVLGMRRGDIVLTQILATSFSVFVGALAGLALGTVLIRQTKAMLVSRAQETADATGGDIQDFDAIFASVNSFFWPVIIAAVIIGVLAALYPAFRTAKTDPAKVLQS
ncbi:MAG: ATP-binding cassette domain-containing protein [Paracoccaceae bacterium]|nr:ATP-binding cassette domain-containing protein [Paracoccaceae bacterium]